MGSGGGVLGFPWGVGGLAGWPAEYFTSLVFRKSRMAPSKKGRCRGGIQDQ